MDKSNRTRWRSPAVIVACALVFAAVVGCGESSEGDVQQALPQGAEATQLDPADFTTESDNPWWPMHPGDRWVYRETDTSGAEQRIVVEVTDRTRTMANGVEARVVRDTASENGELIEVTDDWYAQDSDGNVWYLGEKTAEYRNGKVATRAGSWEAGVDGAEAGIAMPADPQPGMAYRQEYYEGEAEDRAAVVTRGAEQVQVPQGFFDEDIVMTRDLAAIEPKVEELKFYSPGVGPVLSVHTDGDGGRAELVRYTQG